MGFLDKLARGSKGSTVKKGVVTPKVKKSAVPARKIVKQGKSRGK